MDPPGADAPEVKEGRPSGPTLDATADTTRLRKSLNRISLIVSSEQFLHVLKVLDGALRALLMFQG